MFYVSESPWALGENASDSVKDVAILEASESCTEFWKVFTWQTLLLGTPQSRLICSCSKTITTEKEINYILWKIQPRFLSQKQTLTSYILVDGGGV